MAEDTGQERSEEPTAKRIEDARKKGQVARSKELSTMAVLLAASAAMLFTGEGAVDSLVNVMKDNFELHANDINSTDRMFSQLKNSIFNSLMGVLPFFSIVFFVAILAPTSVGGWVFSTQAFSFKAEKMNPIKGIARMFSIKSIVELVKAMLKFVIVLSVSILILYNNMNEIFSVASMDVDIAINEITSMLIWSFMIISSSMIIIALIDVPFQIWDHNKQLKMTRQEIKEEFKQSDGNPELKRTLKERQLEISQSRMMEKIPQADVIITNPTHYAVALKYDQDNMSAPIVVAKGLDIIAFQIINVANSHDIPIIEAPPLSRALYYSTKLQEEIPAGLFLTVAQVLAYIFRLKKGVAKKDEKDNFKDIVIPEEFKRDE